MAVTAEKSKRARPTRKVLYEYNGERLTPGEWCKRYDVNLNTFTRRIIAGWTVEEALLEPCIPSLSITNRIKKRNGLLSKQQPPKKQKPYKKKSIVGELPPLDFNKIPIKQNTPQVRRPYVWKNPKRDKRITWKGQTHTTREWGEILGLPESRIRMRLKAGYSLDDALSVNRFKRGRKKLVKEAVQ